MGLLGNYTSLNSNVGNSIGSFSNNYGRLKVSRMMTFYIGDAVVTNITDKSSFINGYTPPYTWHLAPKAGGMSMQINASGSITLSLTPQYPTSIDMTGSGSLSADASLVIGMLCAMLGSGTLTADIVGVANATASMTGSGDFEADISAFGNMVASLVGEGSLTAGIGAIANMSIDITVTGTGLTTANVGNAVFGTPIEGSYTALEVMRLLSAVAAGKTTIVDLGGGNATVTFRDINDTVDRVEAEMNDSERTGVTLDL